ncbi:MAG: nickel-dependent hydrogenase large subunit [Gammaproteobacteria bacterium]
MSMSTVVVDPVTRIEGHLRIEAETDSNGVITRASSAGTMLRGIEVILKGRDPRDAWAFTQRICGVCTSSHAITSVRAIEDALNYPIPVNAHVIRNLIDGAQFVHDHVVHFYHLHALDWVDVVSALNADPAVTAGVQQCISPARTENNTAAYFTDVKTKLQTFVSSGQLGIFKNGYWGHPEYKLPPELNLLAIAHYLEALAWQRSVARLHAVFGGKNPHPSFAVGGVPCAVALNQGDLVNPGDTRLDAIGFDLVGKVIQQMRDFVDQVYVPDTLAIAGYYKDWFTRGESVGNFLTYGDFPVTEGMAPGTLSMADPNNLFIPRGVILNRDLSVIHQLDMNDPEQVQELVSNSWYDYSVGKDAPLHPYAGETTPNYTGPQPPYNNLDVTQSYSWVKSPRWRGMAMEVGPLSHVLMLYAKGHAKTRELVDKTLTDLKLPVKALFSTMGRTAARTLEAKILADEMDVWFKQLKDNIFVAGDVSMHNMDSFDPSTWPAQAQGAGFLEAPRGALGHWVVIENGKIANYQAVVPTTWNAGPRTYDAGNNEISGPYEAALVGHTLANSDQPLEILRTIHSFDPCMGCAVHVMDEDGKQRVQIQVQ